MANINKAIDYYQLYLNKKPDAPNVDLVRARLKSLAKRKDNAQAPDSPPKDTAAARGHKKQDDPAKK